MSAIDIAPNEDSITVPFRFTKDEGIKLRRLAEQFKSDGKMTEHISLFESAAHDADQGEPTWLVCSSPEEIEGYIQGFAIFGLSPTLEAPKDTESGRQTPGG